MDRQASDLENALANANNWREVSMDLEAQLTMEEDNHRTSISSLQSELELASTDSRLASFTAKQAADALKDVKKELEKAQIDIEASNNTAGEQAKKIIDLETTTSSQTTKILNMNLQYEEQHQKITKLNIQVSELEMSNREEHGSSW